jgi:dienelactone hydrolase
LNKPFISTLTALASTLLLGAVSPLVLAQTPASYGTIPVETLFQRSAYKGYVLSPDGKKLAALAPLNGRDNLVVIDLEKRSRSGLTSFDSFDVTSIRWITNDRLFFRVTEGRDVAEKTKYGGSYAIDVDGGNIRNMEKTRGSPKGVALISVLDRTTGDILVAARARRKASIDLYIANTKSNKFELQTYDSPEDSQKFILDNNNVPRYCFSNNVERNDSNSTNLWYRDDDKSKWRLVQTYQEGTPHWIPLEFTSEGKVIVSSDIGRDKAALFEYDPKTEQMGKLILEDARIDLARGQDKVNEGETDADEEDGFTTWTPLLHAVASDDPNAKSEIVGARYYSSGFVNKWFKPELQAIQALVDGALPNRVNTFSPRVLRNLRVLVTSRAAGLPTRMFVYEPVTKALEELPGGAPWLDKVKRPSRLYEEYAARDGLPVPAYLTLPNGKEAKNLPLVVNIHGGPYLRSYGPTVGLETWFLADRGYAVLEPEPRGSMGWGRKHFTSAYGAWGTHMQDDITDGVLHLIKKGIVDPKRVCLYGGSYGGYATLQGLVREPDMFKCGVSIVAVTDLELMQNTTWGDIPVESKAMQEWFKVRLGSADKNLIDRTSPAKNADKIKAPIMLVMGSADIRVPIEHGRYMRDALVKAGKPVDYHVYVGEGHGWQKPENRFDFYKRVEAFLYKHIGN